jgi:hypothetical protein
MGYSGALVTIRQHPPNVDATTDQLLLAILPTRKPQARSKSKAYMRRDNPDDRCQRFESRLGQK